MSALRRGLFGTLAAALVACGGAAPPEARTVAAKPRPDGPPALATPPESRQAFLEIIVVPERWVEKTLALPAPADLTAWAAAPENRAALVTDVRHILVKAKADASDAEDKAAKARAEAALRRVRKGEDFAKVAKEISEDPGNKDKGGLYPGEMVASFVPPFQSAYAALAPGELAKDVVRTAFGWHVIERMPASEEQAARAYRKAKAPELTRKLADELLAKLRGEGAARAVIASAVEAVLGEQAAADADRPQALVVDASHLDGARLPPQAKDGLRAFANKAHAAEALESPIAAPRALVVARATTAAR